MNNHEVIPKNARSIVESFGEITPENIDSLRKILVTSEIVSTYKAAQEFIIEELRKESL